MQKLLLTAAIGLAVLSPSGQALAGKDLDAVRSRGTLICGVAAGGLQYAPPIRRGRHRGCPKTGVWAQ